MIGKPYSFLLRSLVTACSSLWRDWSQKRDLPAVLGINKHGWRTLLAAFLPFPLFFFPSLLFLPSRERKSLKAYSYKLTIVKSLCQLRGPGSKNKPTQTSIGKILYPSDGGHGKPPHKQVQWINKVNPNVSFIQQTYIMLILDTETCAKDLRIQIWIKHRFCPLAVCSLNLLINNLLIKIY